MSRRYRRCRGAPLDSQQPPGQGHVKPAAAVPPPPAGVCPSVPPRPPRGCPPARPPRCCRQCRQQMAPQDAVREGRAALPPGAGRHPAVGGGAGGCPALRPFVPSERTCIEKLIPVEHRTRFEKSGCLQTNLDRRLLLRVSVQIMLPECRPLSVAPPLLRPRRHCHGNQLKVLARDKLITVRTVKGAEISVRLRRGSR